MSKPESNYLSFRYDCEHLI